MTYREMAKWIEDMTEDQKDCDVTVYLRFDHDYLPVNNTEFASENNDVLDPNHPFLFINQ